VILSEHWSRADGASRNPPLQLVQIGWHTTANVLADFIRPTKDIMRYFLVCHICLMMLCASKVLSQEPIAILQDKRIDECSGLASSRHLDDAVWMHNDSGDKPRLFLVGLDGKTRTVCNIRKARAVDWEDMCSFRIADQPWLLIGDIGDNQAKRTKKKSPCTLYLLREPHFSAEDEDQAEADWEVRIQFDYEDGPHNCEGVAVDVERQEILLLTKEAPVIAGVYRLPLELNDRKQKLTAKRIASIPLTFATGLDISPDGRTLVGVTMWDGWVCQRTAEQSWGDALTTSIKRFLVPSRKQGEAVCFSADGKYLLLSSEKKRQPLWRMDFGKVLAGFE